MAFRIAALGEEAPDNICRWLAGRVAEF